MILRLIAIVLKSIAVPVRGLFVARSIKQADELVRDDELVWNDDLAWNDELVRVDKLKWANRLKHEYRFVWEIYNLNMGSLVDRIEPSWLQRDNALRVFEYNPTFTGTYQIHIIATHIDGMESAKSIVADVKEGEPVILEVSAHGRRSLKGVIYDSIALEIDVRATPSNVSSIYVD